VKVSIKEFAVDMEIENKGVELDVRDPKGARLGDLVVTKTGLTWCKGKTAVENGKPISWKKFIDLMESYKKAKLPAL